MKGLQVQLSVQQGSLHDHGAVCHIYASNKEIGEKAQPVTLMVAVSPGAKLHAVGRGSPHQVTEDPGGKGILIERDRP
ncbi:hypothetical protein GN956_G8552 [Arapaima gigas]